MSVADLRNSLGVQEDKYLLLANFKMRVLDIAVNQINETTDYKIEYEQHKRVEPLLVFHSSLS